MVLSQIDVGSHIQKNANLKVTQAEKSERIIDRMHNWRERRAYVQEYTQVKDIEKRVEAGASINKWADFRERRDKALERYMFLRKK